MKVVLIDLDIDKGQTRRKRPFPNLALMKLSAYHKSLGHDVYLNFPLAGADIVYASCVFTWHRNRLLDVPPDSYAGGPGLKLNRSLPYDVEHIMPDYSLYSGVDFSMGFTSRGCIRRCPWCSVPENEGHIKHWADFREFWNMRHNRLLLLDNNILADPEWRNTLSELGGLALEVDFNQGLDIRLVTDEVAWHLRRIRTRKLRFAFDGLSYENEMRRGFALLGKAGITKRHMSFYVLVGFGGDDTYMERMRILYGLGVDVYPMLYKDEEGNEPNLEIDWGEDIFWHGGRQNMRKFLRVAGRLK